MQGVRTMAPRFLDEAGEDLPAAVRGNDWDY
jgi:hypothetical protein